MHRFVAKELRLPEAMYPPFHLDIDPRAISGITGCISIAFWVIVFSPQIVVNVRYLLCPPPWLSYSRAPFQYVRIYIQVLMVRSSDDNPQMDYP